MAIKRIEDKEHKQEEDTTKEEVKEKKHIIKVVAQLPMQPVRQAEDDTAVYTYVTIEEYLSAEANRGEE